MVNIAPLLSPLTINNLKLRNRIVMSPMTRGFSPNGVPNSEVAAYYRRRAEGGVGLVVTEGIAIEHNAAVDAPNIPVMYGEDALAGWRKVVEAVHEAGGKIFPQLWHMGPMLKVGRGTSMPDTRPMRPSGIWGPVGENRVWGLDEDHIKQAMTPIEEMTTAEIDATIEAYCNAAIAAKNIGFDGIAIHGAHGYLPDAFLWKGTNQRTDSYGGDIDRRTRYIREVVSAIRYAVGPDTPIMLRFSQWKQQDYKARIATTADELERILLPISEAGIDIFDASTRRFWEPEFEGSHLNLAGWSQKITGKPAMTVGSVGLDKDLYGARQSGGGAGLASLDQLMEHFNRGDFELVGIGRLFLSNPDLVNRLECELPLEPFDRRFLAELL